MKNKKILILDYDGTVTSLGNVREDMLSKKMYNGFDRIIILSNSVNDSSWDAKRDLIASVTRGSALEEAEIMPLRHEFLKPATRIIPYILNESELSETLVVGDSISDYYFAKNAGIDFMPVYKFAKITQAIILYGHCERDLTYVTQQFYASELGFDRLAPQLLGTSSVSVTYAKTPLQVLQAVESANESKIAEKYLISVSPLSQGLKAEIDLKGPGWNYLLESPLDAPWGGVFPYHG